MVREKKMNSCYLWVLLLLGGATAQALTDGLPIHVPRCCPDQYALAPDHTCVLQPQPAFEPLVVINGELMTVANVGTEVRDVACGEGEGTVTYIPLRDASSLLVQVGDAVEFLWLPTGAHDYMAYQHFCLAMEMTVDSSDPLYVAKVCRFDAEVACAEATCVRKCCPREESLKDKKFCTPVDENEEWQPSFSSSETTLTPALPPSDLLVVYGFPTCETILIYDDHVLLDTGEVSAAGLRFSQQEYCIENNNESLSREVQELAMICFRDESSSHWTCPWKQLLISVLMSISCVSLAITWIIYVSVPLLRNRNMGRCVISFVSALFVSFLTIVIINNHREGFSAVQCSVTASVSHMSILATFFWINVMSYHIFTHLKLPYSDQREGCRLFLLYCLYAWGFPVLVSLIGLILDITEADFVRPHFELPSCWFFDEVSRWVYQYGILLVLIVINICFFAASVTLLRQRHSHGSQVQTVSAWVYLRLFIITGVLWITEFITWQVSSQCNIAVVILDIINSLQGVYIFLVSVCFRRDLKVFHCGWPQLAVDTEGHVASDAGEVTDLMDAPPRKD